MAQNSGFQFRGVLSRFVTPKASGNQNAVFCFYNPNQSGIEIKIFSLMGFLEADLNGVGTSPLPSGSLCPSNFPIPSLAGYMTWNGTSNGQVVHSGVYVYQVKAEGQTKTGTLIVVR